MDFGIKNMESYLIGHYYQDMDSCASIEIYGVVNASGKNEAKSIGIEKFKIDSFYKPDIFVFNLKEITQAKNI